MKTLKFAVLILAVLTVNSCGKNEVEEEIEIPPSIFLNITERRLIGGHYCSQELLLSFQGRSGKDLVKGIGFLTAKHPTIRTFTEPGGEKDAWGEVKRETHALDRIYEDVYVESDMYREIHGNTFPYNLVFPPMGFRRGKPFSKKYPELNGNYDYLYFQTDGQGSPGSEYLFREKVTFRLTCPHIFGDDAEHDIDTWWKPGEDRYVHGVKVSGIGSPICYRMEIDGKEVTGITYINDDRLLTYYGKFDGPYSLAMVVLER